MRRRCVGAVVAVVLATGTMALSGCAGDTPAYVDLQNSIKQSITKDVHRPVASVACGPHVNRVEYRDGIVHFHCVVQFTDGSRFSTKGTVEARSYQVSGYRFTFDEPPPVDLTRAPLPRPGIALAPDSANSLFSPFNLAPVLRALRNRFGSNQLILALALYPGELEAVIGANGRAQLVTAGPDGRVRVRQSSTFDGPRSGIDISQFNPNVPGRLTQTLTARYRIAGGRIDHFALVFLPHAEAGWNIFLNSGARFRAGLVGDGLRRA